MGRKCKTLVFCSSVLLFTFLHQTQMQVNASETGHLEVTEHLDDSGELSEIIKESSNLEILLQDTLVDYGAK